MGEAGMADVGVGEVMGQAGACPTVGSDRWAGYKDQVADLIARHRRRVDYLAIRVEHHQGAQIMLRGDVSEGRLCQWPEALSEDMALGGQVRAFYQGGWGFASFNRLADLPARVEDAIAAARLIGAGLGDSSPGLAPIEIVQTTCRLPLTGRDPRQVSLADKKALCQHYTDCLRGTHADITATLVRYEDSYQQVLLATSEGTLIDQGWADMEMRFSATARHRW